MLCSIGCVFFGGIVLCLAFLPLFSVGAVEVGRNSDQTYYSDKELFAIDPHGALEEVVLETYEESKSGLWAGFPLSERRKT